METDGAVTFTDGQILTLCIAILAAFTTCWLGVFFFIRKKPADVTAIITNDVTLRILTVVVVIVASGLLAILGRFSGEIAAIFSGIAGYVLGGGRFRRPSPEEESEAAPEQQPTSVR